MSWAFQPLLAAAVQAGAGGPPYTLAAGAGSVTLTGKPAALAAARRVAGGQASVALSGQAAALRTGRHLPAGATAFTLPGETISLRIARLIAMERGSIALAGQPAQLSSGPPPMAADDGAFSMAGGDAPLLCARRLDAGRGAFDVALYPPRSTAASRHALNLGLSLGF